MILKVNWALHPQEHKIRTILLAIWSFKYCSKQLLWNKWLKSISSSSNKGLWAWLLNCLQILHLGEFELSSCMRNSSSNSFCANLIDSCSFSHSLRWFSFIKSQSDSCCSFRTNSSVPKFSTFLFYCSLRAASYACFLCLSSNYFYSSSWNFSARSLS